MPQSNKDDPQNLNDESQLDQMLSGGGEMGALIRTLNWANTPLGPIESWPQSLRTAVSICLFSRFPIHIWWGPEFVEIYNDAYRPILGNTKHPASLGQPGAATSAEIWHIIGPMLRNVYENAVSTWSSNLMLPMERYGYTEETYFTLSYSPIFIETGGVGGVFTVVTETTLQMLGERRLRTLHRLSEHASDAKTVEETCRRAEATLEANREDIPFALIYLLNEDDTQARLVCRAGVETDSDMNIPVIDLTTGDNSPWPLDEVLASGQAANVTNLTEHFNTLPPSPWPEHPHTALVLPILSSGGAKITGFLIGGISALLALDEDYQHFYELVAGHIATAITNVRAYEEERKRAEALAELDRAKTEFFSNVSHEFRTPLTLMLNPLREVLNKAETLSVEHRENLEIAYRNSLRLQKLVNTLLDFSRIQANRIQASFEPTDLAALTTDIVSSFRSVVERAGLSLKLDCPPLSEPVYVDREMWEKIILNVLSNAFKFTFEGEIAVALQANGDFAELQVRDTGIGIAKTDLAHIFERFHRVVGARSRTYEGSGIGLALVAELVRFHGGHIEAASTPDVGTTFTVSIPLGTAHLPQDQISTARTWVSTAISAASYTEEALRWLKDDERQQKRSVSQNIRPELETTELAALTPGSLSDSRILVVDDNADMRDYLRRLLEQRYQVQTANDGLAALALIEQHPPNLIIADIMMPNLDGFGLLQRLRSDPQTRTLPVMLLSARAGEEARIEGLQAGANDYLTKPFSARELLARVEAQLQLAQLRHETQTTIENIIEGIADPFYALDREWRFVYVNERAQQIWGKSRSDLIGSSIWDIFPHMVESPAYEAMHRAAAEQRPDIFETFSTSLNRWVEVNLYPSSRGLAVYFRDISERKRIEAALREAEERLRLMVDSAKDYAIFALDVEGRITTWNSGAERVFGYTEAEIIGVDGAIIYTPEDRQAGIPEREIRKAVELGYAENERWHLRKDNRRFFASGMLRPIRDETGTLRGFTKIARDTTERKLAEERTELLQLLTAELSAQITPTAMAAAIIHAVHRAVGECITSVFLLSSDGKMLERLTSEGLPEVVQQQINHLPLTGTFPVTDAVRRAEIVWIPSQEAYKEDYPVLQEQVTQLDIHTAVAIPLKLDEQLLGCLSLSFQYPRQLAPQEREVLITIAHLCAQALERARLYQQTREIAAVEERQRLARELHDAVSQTLFSATIMAESLPKIWRTKPDRAILLLEDTVKFIRAAMAEMRTLLLELRPERIVSTPLNELIEQLVTAFQGRKSAVVEYSVEGEELRLEPDVHVAIYRIAQESFNNITKHSDASKVTVLLNHQAAGLSLTISDNGQGFDLSGITSGFGLTSIQERAERIGAVLKVNTVPGQGVQIYLQWERQNP